MASPPSFASSRTGCPIARRRPLPRDSDARSAEVMTMTLLPLARCVPLCVVGFAAVSSLTACGDGNGETAADGRGSDDEMQARLDELSGSGSRLTLSGAVTSRSEERRVGKGWECGG